MSRNQRIGLIVAAVVFAAVAFVIASPDDDDGGGERAAQTTPTTPTETQAQTDTEPAEQPHETIPPEQPAVTRIRIRSGEVA